MGSEGHARLVFLDFDNTLFPTNVVHGREPRNLLAFETQVMRLLSMATTFTENVYIVSNGTGAWIDNALRYYPTVSQEFVENGRVQVVSAKDRYGRPDTSPLVWKSATMACIARDHRNLEAIVSIGDAEIDLVSANLVGQKLGVPVRVCKIPECQSLSDYWFTISTLVSILEEMVFSEVTDHTRVEIRQETTMSEVQVQA